MIALMLVRIVLCEVETCMIDLSVGPKVLGNTCWTDLSKLVWLTFVPKFSFVQTVLYCMVDLFIGPKVLGHS